MKISIATLGRERSIATLTKRVYRFDDKTPPELVERAQAALLAANPGLSAAGGFRNGLSVLVPEIAGLAPEEATRSPGADAGAGQLAAAFQDMLEALRRDCTTAVAEAKREAELTLEDLGSGKIREAIDKNAPHLAAVLGDVE